MSDAANAIPTVTIDVVSDVVCPWCFIGKRRLEKALAMKPNIPVEVRFHPYFLNPWVPREGMTRDEYLTTKFGSPERYQGIAGRVAAAAASEGLVYAVDKMRRQPNTLDCHRLILWAGAIGKAAEMKQRLMDLYFTEGADLSDSEVLVAAASSIGLDAAEIREKLATDLDVDKVDFAVSAYASTQIAAAMPIMIQKKRLFISLFGTGINDEFNYDKYFSMLPTGPTPKPTYTKGFFEIAMAQNPKPTSVAIAAADAEFGRNACDGARENAKELKLKITYDRNYPPSTTDFAPVVRARVVSAPAVCASVAVTSATDDPSATRMRRRAPTGMSSTSPTTYGSSASTRCTTA